MKIKLGVLLLASSAMIAPAAAQQGQSTPAQAAAKALLQAAAKAIGVTCEIAQSEHTEGPADGNSWASLHDTLRSDGYTVHFDQTDPRKVKVIFSKDGKTADGKGLLNVHWDKQVNGQAIYVCSDSKWNLVDVNAKAQEKPPLLGDWTPIATDPDTSSVVSTFRNNYDVVK